jgi:hypothetical protein
MEPEVLAEHQVVEFQKLRDRYQSWADSITVSDKPQIAAISSMQTRAILRVVVKDMDRILEQL